MVTMDIVARDQNGNRLRVGGEDGGWVGVEASRVEGIAVALSDDCESIILTITLEES
jgi:hypothetical protein